MEHDQHQDRPGAVRPREPYHAPGAAAEDERIPLDDVEEPPAENPTLDDV